MAQNYECVLIMDPALSEDAVQALQNQFSKLISDRGGEVVHTKSWGKRRLAYPIERKREGIYVIIYFRFEMSAKGLVDEIERQVRINDQLLREMTVKVPELKIDENPPPEFTFRREYRSPRPYRGAGPSRAPISEREAPEAAAPEEAKGETSPSPSTNEAAVVEAKANEPAGATE